MALKITIIGAGPGGYVAAVRAAQLGAEVTLIECDTVGGTGEESLVPPSWTSAHTPEDGWSGYARKRSDQMKGS